MLAETCVFGKQSPRTLHCGLFQLRAQALHLNEAPLLPKLRGYFAEFLSEVSLDHLRIFSSPTCVGSGYGYIAMSLRGFSWQPGIESFPLPEGRVDISPQLRDRIYLISSTPTTLYGHNHRPDFLSFCVTPSVKPLLHSTGI